MDHCREGKQRLPARILSLPSERPVSNLGAVTRGSTLQMSDSIGAEMLSKTVSLGLLPGSRFRCDGNTASLPASGVGSPRHQCGQRCCLNPCAPVCRAGSYGWRRVQDVAPGGWPACLDVGTRTDPAKPVACRPLIGQPCGGGAPCPLAASSGTCSIIVTFRVLSPTELPCGLKPARASLVLTGYTLRGSPWPFVFQIAAPLGLCLSPGGGADAGASGVCHGCLNSRRLSPVHVVGLSGQFFGNWD